MSYICRNKDKIFATWAARHIEGNDQETAENSFGPYQAFGIMTGPNPDDHLMGVVVFHNWVQKYRTCEMSGASVDPRWASKGTIRKVLSIPFIEWNATKVWTCSRYTEERIIRLNKATGFRQEGILRNHLGVDEQGKGIHAVICGMLREEYMKRYMSNAGIEEAAA